MKLKKMQDFNRKLQSPKIKQFRKLDLRERFSLVLPLNSEVHVIFCLVFKSVKKSSSEAKICQRWRIPLIRLVFLVILWMSVVQKTIVPNSWKLFSIFCQYNYLSEDVVGDNQQLQVFELHSHQWHGPTALSLYLMLLSWASPLRIYRTFLNRCLHSCWWEFRVRLYVWERPLKQKRFLLD